MRIRGVVVLSLSIVGLLAGCGGETPPPETPPPPPSASAHAMPMPEVKKEEPPPPEPKKEEPPPPPPKKSAKDIVTGGGTFMFSLDDSSDAKKMNQDDCGKKSKKQDKIDACMKDVAATAMHEGMRFEKDDKGAWWWVSFGQDAKGKEVVYNKVAFKITKEEDGKLTTAPEGKDVGKRPMKTLPKEVVVEVPDENTIAMTDPKKGRLVFKKKLARLRAEREKPGRLTGLSSFVPPAPARPRAPARTSE